jgi:hypothetical protein
MPISFISIAQLKDHLISISILNKDESLPLMKSDAITSSGIPTGRFRLFGDSSWTILSGDSLFYHWQARPHFGESKGIWNKRRQRKFSLSRVIDWRFTPIGEENVTPLTEF